MEFLGHGINLKGFQLCADKKDIASFSEAFKLTESFAVNGIDQNNNIQLTSLNISDIQTGELIIIGQADLSNDEMIYQITDVSQSGDSIIIQTNPLVNIQNLTGADLRIFRKRDYLVSHQLNSTQILFSIVHESGKLIESSGIAKIENSNQILLQPELPVTGRFTITIFAKNP